MWSVGIFDTRTGIPQQVVEVSPDCSWETRITGKGAGKHTVPLFEAGFSQSFIREISTGNKYTIAQMWDDHVVYAGVIQLPKYDRRTQLLAIHSVELRMAYMNDRMLYGVPDYELNAPDDVVLSVSSKSHSGAARAVIAEAMSQNFEWELPIDLPADGSGGFSAAWTYGERLKWEDHLAQIEDDGCEIFFRPYLDGSGYLRYETIVESVIGFGSPTAIDLDDPDNPLVDVGVQVEYGYQMTGVLGFGKGGATAINAWAGIGGAAFGIRDYWVQFPDITDQTRLQDAVDALYAELYTPIEQWSFGAHIYPGGPEFVAPGRLLTLTVAGDPYIADGDHSMRVVALRGDMSQMVKPEVQYGS